jgi:hypothetical protein
VMEPPATASRAEEISIGWSPSDASDPMTWSASGDCIESAGGSITGDPGSLVIGANTLRKKTPADPNDPTMAIPDSCLVTLSVRRVRDGSVDPAFEEGGSFSATQLRSTQFTSAP